MKSENLLVALPLLAVILRPRSLWMCYRTTDNWGTWLANYFGGCGSGSFWG